MEETVGLNFAGQSGGLFGAQMRVGRLQALAEISDELPHGGVGMMLAVVVADGGVHRGEGWLFVDL